jgi:UDP-GlcNAc:undecaprenyl-phosphate GlcNAc-1-phosphate transferase
MMISNVYLTIFAFAMLGCVLATPLVTWVANRVGAVDRPDHFRRIHQGAIPRLGGLALAFGVAAATVLTHLDESLGFRAAGGFEIPYHSALLIAAMVILIVGFIDDTRSLGPRIKLLGQGLAVLTLYLGGLRIRSIEFLSLNLDLGFPGVRFDVLGFPVDLALPSLLVTMFWFLGCMNIWNLIDGMDGLAAGVGLLVSGTLTLVAIHSENVDAAVLAVALAGSLAGFLLYNWHPACIFLGDSGSLLIGLLIGVIGVQGSMEGPSAMSILFPIVAMGLPISDTAMAIFRRWVRNLPLSAADRRHVHHLLIGLGLNPRQAALMLYCFSAFLCGVVMLGVARRNEYLTLVLGVFGCLAFLLVLTSRRDELANLCDDFQDRLSRRRQEREAAKLTWEAIQRIELCPSATSACAILEQAGYGLGCEQVRIESPPSAPPDPSEWEGPPVEEQPLSRPSAVFRLSGGRGQGITVGLGLGADAPLAADIVFRSMQRLGQALSDRLERFDDAGPDEERHESNPATASAKVDRSAKGKETARSLTRTLLRRTLARIGALGLAAAARPRAAVDPLAGPNAPAR